jgi:hypothetical protein
MYVDYISAFVYILANQWVDKTNTNKNVFSMGWEKKSGKDKEGR